MNWFYSKPSAVKRAFKALLKTQGLMLPLQAMQNLAEISFELVSYNQLAQAIQTRFECMSLEVQDISTCCKVLVLLDYLMKHGPSAWIDFLTDHIHTLKRFVSLAEVEDYRFKKQVLDQIKILSQKAKLILALVLDKAKLQAQKQLSIRLKMRLESKAIALPPLHQNSQSKGLYNLLMSGLRGLDQKLQDLDRWIDSQLDNLLGIQGPIDRDIPLISLYNL